MSTIPVVSNVFGISELTPTAHTGVYLDHTGTLWLESDENPTQELENQVPHALNELFNDEIHIYDILLNPLRTFDRDNPKVEPDYTDYAVLYELSVRGNVVSEGSNITEMFDRYMNEAYPLETVVLEGGERCNFVRWYSANWQLYGAGFEVEDSAGRERYPAMEVDWQATADANPGVLE